MNDIFILTDHPQLYSSKRLFEECLNKNLTTHFFNPFSNVLSLCGQEDKNKKTQLVLHRTTGIHHHDYDLSSSYYLQSEGAKIVNSLECFHLLRGKEKQALFFHKEKIPSIPTFTFRGRPDNEIISKISTFFKNSSYETKTFILKTNRGNQGIGVNIIRGEDSLLSILETLWAIKDQDFIIQPFLNIEREFRIFSIEGKIVGALSRTPKKNEFRSNSARAHAEACLLKDIPDDLHHLIDLLYKKTHCHYAGIDLLEVNKKFSLIEYNLVPGFEQMERLTNMNIAKLIIESALGDQK